MRMLWVIVCALGLAVEISVIVGLGRHVTRRYEAEEATTEPPPGAAEDVDRRPAPQRAA
jgi:hypothetical protein